MHKKLISTALILVGLFTAIAVIGNDQKSQEIVGHFVYGNGPARVIVMHDWMGDSENYRPMLRYLDTSAFTYAFIDVRG